MQTNDYYSQITLFQFLFEWDGGERQEELLVVKKNRRGCDMPEYKNSRTRRVSKNGPVGGGRSRSAKNNRRKGGYT